MLATIIIALALSGAPKQTAQEFVPKQTMAILHEERFYDIPQKKKGRK